MIQDVGLNRFDAFWNPAFSTPFPPNSKFQTLKMNRRAFLQSAAGLAAFSTGSVSRATAQIDRPRKAAHPTMKAAVIGHSGRGRYGHSLEVIFSNRPGIEIVAVADPVEGGRKKVQQAIGALRTYADYREMLERERPNLVAVTPRWTEHRHAMVTAALAVGAHVLCEKPFTHSLEDADDMLAQAKRAKRKLAVCHPVRLAPATVYLKSRIEEGMIGELRSIRANGKQDKRAGGEDLLVHGAHLFDLLRLFAGDATEVKARVLHEGRDITLADVRKGDYDTEIGPIAGDDVEAWFKMTRGVAVHFTTRRRPSAPAGPYSIEFTGTKGAFRLECGYNPVIKMQHGNEWRPLEGNPAAAMSAADAERNGANGRVVDDWLAAIAEDREAQCSGYGGMKFVEMVVGIYAAALSRQTVALPLKNRRHPLLG